MKLSINVGLESEISDRRTFSVTKIGSQITYSQITRIAIIMPRTFWLFSIRHTTIILMDSGNLNVIRERRRPNNSKIWPLKITIMVLKYLELSSPSLHFRAYQCRIYMMPMSFSFLTIRSHTTMILVDTNLNVTRGNINLNAIQGSLNNPVHTMAISNMDVLNIEQDPSPSTLPLGRLVLVSK